MTFQSHVTRREPIRTTCEVESRDPQHSYKYKWHCNIVSFILICSPLQLQQSTSSTMVRTRRGNHRAPSASPTCDHCGSTGHIAAVCSRTIYAPDLPSLRCPHCVRTVRSGWSNEPNDHEVLIVLDPCLAH